VRPRPSTVPGGKAPINAGVRRCLRSRDGDRPRTNAGPVKKDGGNPTGSGHCAHPRLQHRGRSSAADSQPYRRAGRAAADQPSPRTAGLGRPAGRCRAGLGCHGATVTRVGLRPGSAVVAAFRPLPSPAPAADPPPLPRRRCTAPHARSPGSDGDLSHVSPSVPVGPPLGACHAPPGGATFRLDPATGAVGFPIPSPSPAGAGRLRAGRRGHPRRSVCRDGHRDARQTRDSRYLRPVGGLHRRPPTTCGS
jgi:hypothetical protein